MEKTTTQSKKRVLAGVVMSDKMKDTIVVAVNTFKKVTKYQKYIQVTKRYKAHDAGNTKKIGEKVEIIECAPISKDKRFTLVK